MPEQPNPLEGADAPRPMPTGLRARLEEALLANASMPDEARERLAEKLSDPAAALLSGIDGPRPLPARARRRVEQALAASRATPRRVPVPSGPWLAAAAVILLFLASVTVLTNPRDRTEPTSDRHGADSAAGMALDDLGVEAAPGATAGGAAGVGRPGFAAGPVPADAPAALTSGRAAKGSGGAGGTPRRATSAPPFGIGDSEAVLVDESGIEPDGGSGGGTSTTTTTPPPPPPFRVALVNGDAKAVAGFNAYVWLLNQRGGAGGRPFVVVGASERADARVDLSGDAPAAAGGITVASLATPDRLLRGDTFSFAGPVDRLGHLIADAVYPAAARATAVVYREQHGVYATDVPAAIEAALRAKGVTVVVREVRADEGVVPVPADAVFLSLTPDNAKRVVAAYPSDARPARGFNGVGSLAEQPAETGLPQGSRVVGPYTFPNSNEARRVAELTKLPGGARVYNGWIVAKTLAVAVWRYDPRSPVAVRAALQSMSGYANGFAPAYTYRPGTNAVRPEGVLLTVSGSGLAQSGEFLTDPRN